MGELPAPRLRWTVAFPSLALVALAVYGAKSFRETRAEESTANFAVDYPKPEGWKMVPHGPQTLFLFKHAKSKLLLRGAVNQVVSDVNPTPELDTEGIAQFFLDRTAENQPDWTGKKLNRVDAEGTSFRLIERERKGKRVVVAFAVRGNTTLLVSLSGNGTEVAAMPATLPEFERFLSQIEFRRQSLAQY